MAGNRNATKAKPQSQGPPPSDKPPSRASVRKRRPSKKVAPADSEDEGEDGKKAAVRVNWKKDLTRGQRVLDWLDENPDQRHKLFSDSTETAKEEGRTKKTAKTSKTAIHALIAKAVFTVDADPLVRDEYAENPGKYVTAVGNFFTQLRKQYRESNDKIGRTGAGLRYEDITEGSDIWNIVQSVEAEFPFWQRLHGYWRTIPSFNPQTVSSEPGQDLDVDAAQLFTGIDSAGKPDDEQDEDGEENQDGEELDMGDTDYVPERHLSSEDSFIDIPPPPAKLSSSSSFSSPLFNKENARPNVKAEVKPFLLTKAKPTPPSSKGAKRTRAETFADEMRAENEMLERLAEKKHDRRVLELSYKKQKLEVEAEEKRRIAEREHYMMQCQRERERELHEMRMAQMQMRQNGSGTGMAFGNGDMVNGFTGMDAGGFNNSAALHPFDFNF
ncbi:hypothetical protein C8J56DRAFT_398656 [Mycena floridula]|nr:hypothetical protein C8J56DRAFT_398656 [Mycena floridula]